MAKWGEGDPRWIVEERPDATNVNNWHWTEKNACQWSQTKLKELLTGVKIPCKEAECLITELTKCEGDATVNNRKGRIILFYEWNLEMKWEAKGMADDNKLKAKGKVFIPNLSEENELDELDISANVEEKTPFAYTMKDMMNKEGVEILRQKIAEYLQLLKDEYSKGLILPSKDALPTPTIATKSVAALKLTDPIKDDATENQNVDTSSYTLTHSLMCPMNEAYKCFTDSNMISAYTRGTVLVDAKPGGKFSLFNGHITGEFLELEDNARIKQYWRRKDWKNSINSKVELIFEQTNEGTNVTINHSGVPTSELESTQDGWNIYYWNAIKETFGFGAPLSSGIF